MNKLAIISAFLGGVRNRYMKYHPDRDLPERLAMAARVQGCDGIEACFPEDFADFTLLKQLLDQHGLGVSAINFRSRRQDRWWRGSFSSQIPAERREVVDELRRVMDYAAELGCNRVTTCPLNEGADVPFEADPIMLWDFAAEAFSEACAHNRDVRVCIEYKKNDPRARVLIGTAGETAAFCAFTGAENLGATFDIGHSILAQENPSAAAVLLHRSRRLFYVHLNDNDGHWDWDMIPGTYHLWEFVELFHTLEKLGYQDDWYAFDVLSKEIDQVETFDAVMSMTRKLESITGRIDRSVMADLLAARNPARTIQYLYSLL